MPHATRPVGLLLGLSLVLGLALAAPAALAQSATPAATFPAMAGLPELRVTITDTGFQAPAEASAGLTLLTVTNATAPSPDGSGASAMLMLPPAGISAADAIAVVHPGAGTPEASEPPAWAYHTAFAGGATVPAGQTMESVVDLTPGDWVLWNDNFGPQTPQVLHVAGNAASPAAAAEPDADVVVGLQEYAFTGLEHGVPAGPHVWKVTNAGKQPHFMVLLRADKPVTIDQVMAMVALPDNATPPPSLGVGPQDFSFDVPGLATLSPGATAWVAMDLAPGTYVALCFFPDEAKGVPHAMLGMADVFTVGDGAAATPAP